MKKSTLLLLMLGATATQAFANKGAAYAEPPHHRNYFNGFNVTLSGGGTAGQFDIDQEANLDVVAAFFEELQARGTQAPIIAFIDTLNTELENDAQIQGNSWAGQLGLGYSWQFGHGVIGVEVTAGLTDVKAKYQNTTEAELTNIPALDIKNEFDIRLHNDFALLLKPGFVIKHKTMLYAFFGPRWGNFKTSLETEVTTSLINGTPTVVLSQTNEESSYQFGLTGGVGIESFVSDNFTIGLEYAYTNYGNIPAPDVEIPKSFLIGGRSPTAEIFVDLSDDPTLEAATNTIMLELGYRF